MGIRLLYAVSPALPAMPPGAAILTILSGTGLLLTAGDLNPMRRHIVRACALAVVALATAFLLGFASEYAPFPAASFNLALLGIGLLLIQASRPPVLVLGSLSVFSLALPLCRLLEVLLAQFIERIEAAGFFFTTSLNVALALSLLAGPALFLHPRLPFGRLLFSANPYSSMIRMIMPLCVVVPVGLAIFIEVMSTYQSQTVHLAIITALGLLGAVYSALIWHGYEKLQCTTAALHEKEATTRSIMDSLPHAIAVIDHGGRIVSVNDSWRHFALDNVANAMTQTGLGLNYLDTCRSAQGNAYAREALVGIEDVIDGCRDAFALEYPCHAPDRQRWFSMRVNPLPAENGGVVISHLDITKRKLAELESQHDREQQTALRQILETVLYGNTLETTLERCLDLLLAVPWLAILPRGGIHLMADKGDHLDLTVSRGLQEGVLRQCQHLPLNRCLCGKAAAAKKTLFASHVDPRHEIAYPNMPDHGHYCIPMFGNRQKVIGVLVLYLQAGAQRNTFREQFLDTAAGILASFVLRKRGEDALAKSHTALEQQQLLLEEQVRDRTADLATSEARTRAVLHTMADGVIQIDSRGIILIANYAVSTLFGYEHEELIGNNVSLLMPEPHHSQHDGYLENYMRTRAGNVIGKRVEVSGRRKDGSLFPLEMAINELVDDNGITFIGVLRDLTRQQALEQAQAAALAEARRLTQLKSTFLANMSHEIRTPLSAVMGFARIGMRENQGRSSHATCARILEAGEHLLGVVNDILDFSKIEAGKLRIEARPFMPAAVIDASRMFVAEAARNKGLELVTDIASDLPAWVTGDALRVEQILTNLLSNAVKFTPAGHVTLKVSQASGSTLRFRVEDTGIGMSTEQLGHLFHAFEQADSTTTREYGGTGLGLAISRRLSQMMGGDISVVSMPGSGSIFTLELPLPATIPADEPAHATPVEGSRRLAGLRLLAADDIEANRLILDDLLLQEGARTVFANDGQQVLDLLAEHGCEAFDAVLMDVQMPVLDGYAATLEIRKRAPYLPVIGLTAHALAEEREKCLAAGMVEHVTKPIDPEVLVRTILQHVGIAPAQQPAAIPPIAVPAEPTFPDRLVDWPALHARFSKKDGFLRKLAASALTSLDDSEQKLADAIARRDFEALAFTAHSLKGMAGNLFAQRVFDLAKAADMAARDRQPVAFELAGQLIEMFRAFRADLAVIADPKDGGNI